MQSSTDPLVFPRRQYRLVDLFAGGGGASLGMQRALGCGPLLAVNHNAAAIEMHAANHPDTQHLISDVFEVDPRGAQLAYLPKLDAIWASPDCRHFSKAKGAKPVSPRVRGLAWIVVKWAQARWPRVLFLENVEEFVDWGPIHQEPTHPRYLRPIKSRKGETFRRFVRRLEDLGYTVDWKVLNAADYGAPTLRKRLFLIARRDGQPIVWPKPTHGDGPSLEPYGTAAECIDWTHGCPSIFGRDKPLADKTLTRIAHGIVRYIVNDPAPFLAPVRGAAVAPFFVPRYGERKGQAPRARRVDRPMPTVVGTGNGATLVSAMLSKHYGGVVGTRIDAPCGTISGRDSQSVTAAQLRHGLPADERTDRVAAFLAKYYGDGGQIQKIGGPLHTITSKGRFSLVACRIRGEDYAITDIGMRMLQPRELARAQGFPDDYELVGTKTQQIHKIGNSVPPPVVAALVSANLLSNQRRLVA